MSYSVPLPDNLRCAALGGVPPRRMEMLDGWSTAVQRQLRRGGLRSFERQTMATLLAVFSRQTPGFVFFDVGANIGLYSMLCELLFKPGKVVAFEPTPGTAAITRRIAAENGVDTVVEQVALGDEPGEADLFLSDVSDSSNSLLRGFKPSAETVAVLVETLDGYVESTGVVPNVIKIDVEGFEPQVLAGGEETLRRHRPTLVVEVLHRLGRDYGPALNDVLDRFGYTNYRISSIPTWEPRPKLRGGRKARKQPGREREGSPYRDWLLMPEPLPAEFAADYGAWCKAIGACTKSLNAGDPGRSLGPAPTAPESEPDAASAP